ncbi:hypothetical protein DV515_00011123 [Chloebia gouldiae]|uniref:Uncharacterized protein n=1 Tax=Chloebia gouldiae TaxID=44316 RepID=A0A3L8S7E8_CHLGU|nr:hypothetical protein DV515_00011123 [Chloebia gouldiae]
MKAAVDLTIIKTEKVDIELFPSPGVNSAAAGCGYCSEPSPGQNKGCCSHTGGVWLLADPGCSAPLYPAQVRWRMELGGPAGKKSK